MDEHEQKTVPQRAFAAIHGQSPMRTYSVAEVKQIVYPLIDEIARLQITDTETTTND